MLKINKLDFYVSPDGQYLKANIKEQSYSTLFWHLTQRDIVLRTCEEEEGKEDAR